jgi:hypothetical protein
MLKGSMRDDDQLNAASSSKAIVAVPEEDFEDDFEEDVDEDIEAFDSDGEAANSADYSYR